MALADAVAATDAMNLQSVQALGYGVGDILADGSVPFSGGVTMDSSLGTTGDYTPGGRIIVPMGEISYFDVTGTGVSITAQSDGSTNMVFAPLGSLSGLEYEFDDVGSGGGAPAPGNLRYTGTTTKMFHIACSLSFSGGANDVIVLGIAVNDTVVARSKVLRNLGGGGDVGSTAMHLMVLLAQNDTLQVYVGNTSSTNDVTVNALNLFAMGM